MVEKISLIIVTIILISTTILILFLTCNSAFEYGSILIVNEQNDHYYKMKQNTQRLQKDILDIENEVKLLSKNKLHREDKKKLHEKLRELESISLNISKEMSFYQEDTTVHLFFKPSGNIVSLFDDSRHVSVYVNRFVRSVEQGLFEKYLSNEQAEIILKNFDLLKEKVISL